MYLDPCFISTCMRREMLQVMLAREHVGLQNHTKATNNGVRKTGTMQSL